jgi:putative membrane-bound dehydrogenase-like protein
MLRSILLGLVAALLAALPTSPNFAADDEAGFVSLFDGKSLKGWDGNPEFWSVRDGVITGQTTAEKPTRGNTFLVYRPEQFDNFELQAEFRIVGGNSGIQYRSKEVGKWVIGGYQADFDAAGQWAGTLYEEKGRGVLAKRGQKVEVPAGGKPKVVGETAAEKDIVAALKKEDWNSYSVIARGNHLVQTLNGITTVDLTDNDPEKRAAKGLIALQLHAGPPMTVQFRNLRIKKLDGQTDTEKTSTQAAPAASTQPAKKIVFIAGRPSHGYGAHEHNAGCILLAKELQAAVPSAKCEVVRNGWPSDASILEGADCIVMYCDGGGGHMVHPHAAAVDALAKKGVGIVCLHYAVEVPADKNGDKFLDWIGGYFKPHWSVNPHWTAKYEKFPDHPISRGVEPFEINDEWYYHMRFREGMKGVTPILTALPPKETLSRPDGPHSGNPAVRAAVLERKEPQHMAWAAEREGGGRGFGFTGGHDHWNWGDPNFRKVVLNAIVWCAQGEVPAGGVESPKVTLADLESNQDFPQPANFNREAVRQKIKLPAEDSQTSTQQPALQQREGRRGNRAAQANRAGRGNNRPAYSSEVVSAATKGHAIDIDVDITGARRLWLVVTDGGDGFGCDWANWAEPRLVSASGEKKLTELTPKSASSDWGSVQMNKNADGKPLSINGQSVEYGIGTHANSVIQFDIPQDGGFTRLKARGGLDDGGTRQGCGSTVQFQVFVNQPPPANFASAAGNNSPVRDAANAVANLDVAEGLEATLFASEPDISNITSIDIDHLGRVWACEVKNYRKHNGSRPEGDRILVLEDTDGDGVCDKQTVFYQGRDIDSAHGICVLGNRVIVSANDKVQVLFDENGDLKADEKRDILFTDIKGTQHDHGIHAFQFGPDGKLYFNFGNSGHQLKDKNGKLVVDRAGNEVIANRKPYQEGMVFRCDLDGSNVETLGWNFRNNWEVTVDSFGTIWQSDNDDDGNRGVRINYVMEFGNYGFKDELTGAGWQTSRENLEAEIPQRHWHLNDPGVVPTMLLTGAGSPTGICVYEGTLLPKQFHGQVIHCDAGPSVCRAYITTKSGAGYKAEIVNVLTGTRDNWYRPSDVCVAPDGSLFVGDWYDPGVGGHNQQEVDKGRIFRVAPPGVKYTVPKYDFITTEGALAALKSPNLSVRYMAFSALLEKGDEVSSKQIHQAYINAKDDPRYRARLMGLAAAWLVRHGQAERIGEMTTTIMKEENADLRVAALRLARLHGVDVALFAAAASDKSPEVRRELAISLRHSKSRAAADLWAQLAQQYDGQDRWYLEALGLAADGQWDAYLGAYLAKSGEPWKTAPGRDILWRSRAKATPELLVKIMKDPATKEEDQPRYFRAFDFLTGPEKEAALKSLLE